MKHLLSIEQLTASDIGEILQAARQYKQSRGRESSLPLQGQTWVLIFSKSSTRTRVSFQVGIRELGGYSLFLNASEIQLGRGEQVKDTARVLGRMVHGAIIRTFAQLEVVEFARHSAIPTINALTDEEHPCQILSDLFTIQEQLGSLPGKVITFVGDAACNVAVSWIFAAARLGFELRLAAPPEFQPPPELLARAGGRVTCLEDPREAAAGAHVIYTDVWVSMGKEAESADRLKVLRPYQINQSLVRCARPEAMVMHCLPAYKGQEIDEETFEKNARIIFDQAENRLHAQKAILAWLVGAAPAS
ncbi:MAG TPA: ornithine carbamoyltransferase [Candidatus Paceibacterota bacterium]|nr:ornithine carbamoyltransferase [Verrucomicrobiota bacterium]HRY48914.1 ornithine carbamoyltransferase [Candidatus Paceibacterota bacterium]HRZ99126.1 ornithine carbamoyltransferase [Candidatus Paceibacterota bacterium]